MAPKDPLADDLNQKINIPKVSSGLSKSMAGGRVETKWKNIKWTKKKLVFTSILLGTPYLIALISSFAAGIYLVTGIFVFLGLLVLFVFLVVRAIEKNDEF